jgi:hypothetical protein
MLIEVLTTANHWSLSCARYIQSTLPHSMYRESITILYSHLYLGCPNGLFLSGLSTETLYILFLPVRAT